MFLIACSIYTYMIIVKQDFFIVKIKFILKILSILAMLIWASYYDITTMQKVIFIYNL